MRVNLFMCPVQHVQMCPKAKHKNIPIHGDLLVLVINQYKD